MHVAQLRFLAAGFLLLSWGAIPPALALDDQITPVPVATQDPRPLQEPHTVGQPPATSQQTLPAKRAEPAPPRRHAAAAKPKARPDMMAKPKPRPVRAPVVAKAKSKPPPQQARLAAKPRPTRQRAESSAHHPHLLAHRARPTPAARYTEERPRSGPVYESPPYAMSSPAPRTTAPLAPACDEACQYRDWLNRYAAWYRDFGRYYGSPPPAVPPGPMPPRAYSEIPPAPVPPPPVYRFDQSERDRLDPWHGYNPQSPDNGY